MMRMLWCDIFLNGSDRIGFNRIRSGYLRKRITINGIVNRSSGLKEAKGKKKMFSHHLLVQKMFLITLLRVLYSECNFM
jgi:hypothetical protein